MAKKEPATIKKQITIICPEKKHEVFSTKPGTLGNKAVHLYIPVWVRESLGFKPGDEVGMAMWIARRKGDIDWIEDERKKAKQRLLALQSQELSEDEEVTTVAKEVDLIEDSLPPGL